MPQLWHTNYTDNTVRHMRQTIRTETPKEESTTLCRRLSTTRKADQRQRNPLLAMRTTGTTKRSVDSRSRHRRRSTITTRTSTQVMQLLTWQQTTTRIEEQQPNSRKAEQHHEHHTTNPPPICFFLYTYTGDPDADSLCVSAK